jgi:hypothetical protein
MRAVSRRRPGPAHVLVRADEHQCAAEVLRPVRVPVARIGSGAPDASVDSGAAGRAGRATGTPSSQAAPRA